VKIKELFRQEGFVSAIILIFLVTLGLMGMGAFVLMKSEGESVANNAKGLQLEYAANGGANYALRHLEEGTLSGLGPFTIGDVVVSADTTVDDEDTYLDISASTDGMDREITLELYEGPLEEHAVVTTGDTEWIFTKDSLGNWDGSLRLDHLHRMPGLDEASMLAVSTSQIHDQSGTFVPLNNYPDTSFYFSPGVPNVTHAEGDMVLMAGRTIYGIFIVEGSVTIETGALIEGVLYLNNEDNSVTISGSGSLTVDSVIGGIVSKGDMIDGSSFTCYVQHDPVYMSFFATYLNNPNARVVKINQWTYE
jgi:hypothetical protein